MGASSLKLGIGWIIACLGILPFPANAQGFDDIHKCDTFAAHPDDPNRWAVGVSDEDIIPGPAIKFCAQAMEDYPDAPRFQFQLGRAFWAARRFKDGTAVFLDLEDAWDYDPVYAYLGDAFFYGIGGVEVDEKLAMTLYQVAADSGFEAAELALAEINGEIPAPVQQQQPVQTAQIAPQQVEPQLVVPEPPAKLNYDSFAQPKIIQALASGNLAALANMGSVSVIGVRYKRLDVYLQGFDGEFAGTYNYKDPRCIRIYNPRVTKRLERNIRAMSVGGGTLEGAMENELNKLIGSINIISSGNLMAVTDQEQQLELLREQGAQDAGNLIHDYSCGAAVTQRIYKNMAAAVIGTAPSLSAEQAVIQREKDKRAKEAADRKAKKQREAAAKRAEEQRKRAEIARQKGLRTKAQSSCVAQFKQEAFCACLVEELDAAQIAEKAWTTLGREFKAVLQLRTDYPTVPAIVKQCRTSTPDK